MVLFADWLTTAVVEREVASGGGAGSARVVLCGHRYVRRPSSHGQLLRDLD